MWWVWFLIAIGVLAGLALIWAVIHAAMKRDPITAGPAMVPGGVTDQTVVNRFSAFQTAGSVRVQNIVRGRVYGAVNVRYADNSSRRLLLTGQAGYRAMVSRDNGPWTEEYMLQGCGNDLRFSGMRYIPGFGFRFVPDTDGVIEDATAQPATPAAPAAPAPPAATPVPAVPAPIVDKATSTAPIVAPAAEDRTTAQLAEDEGEKEFIFRPATHGPNARPNFIDSKGFESFEVTISGDRTVIRFS